MFDINSIRSAGRQVRTYWRRQRLARDLEALSPELRKDIGWPAGGAGGIIGQDSENMRWHAGQANLGALR